MIEAEMRYDGEVTGVAYYEASTGSVGLKFEISAGEHGSIDHVMWLTEKSKDRAAKTLREFGIEPEHNAEFWKDPEAALKGKPCNFSTEMDRGKVRVKWFNGPNRTSARPVEKSVAAAKAAAIFDGPSADDLSVPF